MIQVWPPRTSLHLAIHSDCSGMGLWPNQSEGDSVLRNSFGKRESVSIEGCWEDRKMAWSSWLSYFYYNEGSCQIMEWGERKAKSRHKEAVSWKIAWAPRSNHAWGQLPLDFCFNEPINSPFIIKIVWVVFSHLQQREPWITYIQAGKRNEISLYSFQCFQTY